jgi:hypothetical protein
LEMDSTKLTRINYLIIGLITVLVTGVLLFSGCTKPTLGEAQIVVYGKGEEVVLDSKSPYFKKLQAACEEMIRYSEILSPEEIKNKISPEEIRNREWAIELIYEGVISQHELAFARQFAFQIFVSQLLIPLSGELTSLNVDNESYSALFGSERIRSSEGKIEVYDRWPLKTKKDDQEIKDILTRFDINVP